MSLDTNKIYLSILAKLMKEDAHVKTEGTLLFDKLYSIINDDFYNRLLSSHYPDPATLLCDLNQPLDSIENYLICKETHNKSVFLICSDNPSMVMSRLSYIFENKLPYKVSQLRIKVPILLVHENVFNIICVTNSNSRISLSEDELKCFIEISKKNGINAATIIRYIIICTPLKNTDSCILIDNYYGEGERAFGNFIDKKLYAYTFKQNDESNKTTTVLLEEAPRKKYNFDNLPWHLGMSEFAMYVKNTAVKHYYGLKMAYKKIAAKLFSYYQKNITTYKEMIKSITDDIIRLDGEKGFLSELRNKTRAQLTTFSNEFNEITSLCDTIYELYGKLENYLDNSIIKCNNFSNYAIRDTLLGVFYYAESKEFDKARELADQVERMGYDTTNLNFYFDNLEQGLTTYLGTEYYAETLTWDTAKIMIALIDDDDLNNYSLPKLNRIVDVIGDNITTGKEKYAKALVNFKTKNERFGNTYFKLLKESLLDGYKPAGDLLYKEYQNGNNNIKLSFLVNNLYTDACIAMGNELIENSTYKVYIDSKAMIYYKLAAAMGDKNAISKIVDTIYNSLFSNVPSLHKKDDYSNRLRKNAEAIIPLCNYLIDEKGTLHYTEILGVLLYICGEYAHSMQRLSGINTPASNYCKAKMYEFGDGVSIDYQQALTHYKKAGSFKNSKAAYERVDDKINRKKVMDEIQESYSKESSYSTTTHYTSTGSSGGFCFITTAIVRFLGRSDDCKELNVLRELRDNYICKSQEGQELVLEYYKIAPSILEKINNEEDPDSIYRELWENYILISIEYIEKEEYEKAVLIYINMVRQLAVKYSVAITNPRVIQYVKDLEY